MGDSYGGLDVGGWFLGVVPIVLCQVVLSGGVYCCFDWALLLVLLSLWDLSIFSFMSSFSRTMQHCR